MTYNLVVTNNGPASATNVIVTDPLPNDVSSFQSRHHGYMFRGGRHRNLLIGNHGQRGTATITIVTHAGAPGIASNTASVTADQSDPNLSEQ